MRLQRTRLQCEDVLAVCDTQHLRIYCRVEQDAGRAGTVIAVRCSMRNHVYSILVADLLHTLAGKCSNLCHDENLSKWQVTCELLSDGLRPR